MRHAVLVGALSVSCFSLLCVATPVAGADRSFPFEAAVISNEASVYSGPRTDDYYPTLTLKRGDRVTVVREDFGGWYLIQPLEQSHSWIPVKDVEKKSSGLGMVTRQTSDHIGSNVYSGEFDVMHRLFRGEVVRIKGESTLTINGSPVEMYRIEPPRGEYRYISRRDVVPADEFESQPDLLTSAEADRPATVTLEAPDFSDSELQPGSILPVAEVETFPEPSVSPGPVPEPRRGPATRIEPPDFPVRAPQPDPSRLPSAASEGVSTPHVGFGPAQSLPDLTASPQQRERLNRAWQHMEQIDNQFRIMVGRPISEWNLPAIEDGYRTLGEQYGVASGPNGSRVIDSRINQRLAAVERRSKLFAEYASFQQTMRQTEARDSAIRESYLSQFSISTTAPSRTIVRRPVAVPPAPIPARPAPGTPAAQGQRRNVSRSQPTQVRFDGAGIIQRSALQRQGVPSHVLLAPNGRVLTYLTAVPGVQLDRYLGRAMGIRGPRSFRPELNADLLAVHQLTPVTLRTR